MYKIYLSTKKLAFHKSHYQTGFPSSHVPKKHLDKKKKSNLLETYVYVLEWRPNHNNNGRFQILYKNANDV